MKTLSLLVLMLILLGSEARAQNGAITASNSPPGQEGQGWLIANLAKNRCVWVYFQRFQSTTP